MATQIFTNISLIANTREDNLIVRGSQLAYLPAVENAYLVIEDDIIAGYGPMANCTYAASQCAEVSSGCIVLPAWCDSHTHIVFSGSRENEFVDKIK
jgi:imidazolonepropionase